MSGLYQGIDLVFFLFSGIMLMDSSWKSVLESGQQRDVILKVFVIQTGSLSDD